LLSHWKHVLVGLQPHAATIECIARVQVGKVMWLAARDGGESHGQRQQRQQICATDEGHHHDQFRALGWVVNCEQKKHKQNCVAIVVTVVGEQSTHRECA
jgi:hypothetical protein